MVSNPVIVVVLSESRVVRCVHCDEGDVFIYLHKMHGHPNIKFCVFFLTFSRMDVL
jgi:hypothetical protein